MGWLRLSRGAVSSTTTAPQTSIPKLPVTKSEVQHIEFLPPAPKSQHPPSISSLNNNTLPFIPAHEIKAQRTQKEHMWIVIDNLVYDCSSFVNEHPGGDTVIKSFQGYDCSWQFWTFHTREHLEESAKPLLIGRTENVENRFRAPRKFTGLGKMGGSRDEW